MPSKQILAKHRYSELLASTRAKSGDSRCSSAASALARRQVTHQVAVDLAKCRQAAHHYRRADRLTSAGKHDEAAAAVLQGHAARKALGQQLGAARTAIAGHATPSAKANPDWFKGGSSSRPTTGGLPFGQPSPAKPATQVAASAPASTSEPAPFSLASSSPLGRSGGLFADRGGKTGSLFDMKRGDLPGQTSLLERVPAVDTKTGEPFGDRETPSERQQQLSDYRRSRHGKSEQERRLDVYGKAIRRLTDLQIDQASSPLALAEAADRVKNLRSKAGLDRPQVVAKPSNGSPAVDTKTGKAEGEGVQRGGPMVPTSEGNAEPDAKIQDALRRIIKGEHVRNVAAATRIPYEVLRQHVYAQAKAWSDQDEKGKAEREKLRTGGPISPRATKPEPSTPAVPRPASIKDAVARVAAGESLRTVAASTGLPFKELAGHFGAHQRLKEARDKLGKKVTTASELKTGGGMKPESSAPAAEKPPAESPHVSPAGESPKPAPHPAKPTEGARAWWDRLKPESRAEALESAKSRHEAGGTPKDKVAAGRVNTALEGGAAHKPYDHDFDHTHGIDAAYRHARGQETGRSTPERDELAKGHKARREADLAAKRKAPTPAPTPARAEPARESEKAPEAKSESTAAPKSTSLADRVKAKRTPFDPANTKHGEPLEDAMRSRFKEMRNRLKTVKGAAEKSTEAAKTSANPGHAESAAEYTKEAERLQRASHHIAGRMPRGTEGRKAEAADIREHRANRADEDQAVRDKFKQIQDTIASGGAFHVMRPKSVFGGAALVPQLLKRSEHVRLGKTQAGRPQIETVEGYNKGQPRWVATPDHKFFRPAPNSAKGAPAETPAPQAAREKVAQETKSQASEPEPIPSFGNKAAKPGDWMHAKPGRNWQRDLDEKNAALKRKLAESRQKLQFYRTPTRPPGVDTSPERSPYAPFAPVGASPETATPVGKLVNHDKVAKFQAAHKALRGSGDAAKADNLRDLMKAHLNEHESKVLASRILGFKGDARKMSHEQRIEALHQGLSTPEPTAAPEAPKPAASGNSRFPSAPHPSEGAETHGQWWDRLQPEQRRAAMEAAHTAHANLSPAGETSGEITSTGQVRVRSLKMAMDKGAHERPYAGQIGAGRVAVNAAHEHATGFRNKPEMKKAVERESGEWNEAKENSERMRRIHQYVAEFREKQKAARVRPQP